jgi:DNA-binding MarR family transcriptional regulator
MTSEAAQTLAPDTDAPPDLLRLDLQICFALYSSANLVTRLYRPLLDPLGITYPQYLALMVLWESSPQTVGALGKRLSLDSGTLTPLFKRLEAAGLVERRRDPEDERRVLIDLTQAGRDLHAKALSIPYSIMCQLPLNLDEAMALKGLLTKITDGLGEPAPCAPEVG